MLKGINYTVEIIIMGFACRGLVSFVFLLPLFVLAQPKPTKPSAALLEDYIKRYPDQQIVVTAIFTRDILDLEDGQPTVVSETHKTMVHLSKDIYAFQEQSIHHNEFVDIADIKAINYYPDGTKYKKEQVKDFIDEEVISNGISFYGGDRMMKFRYQNLRKGSFTNLSYKRELKEYRLMIPRFFRNSNLIESQEYVLKVHKSIELGIKTYNFSEQVASYEKREEGNYIIHHWKRKPDFKQTVEGDDDLYLYYEPHIVTYIKSYQNKDGQTDVFSDVNGLYNWYYSLVEQVDQDADEDLKAVAESIVDSSDTELEKVRKVYRWVQSNIKYIAFGDGYGGFVPRNPHEINEKRYGDCKDMSCLMINLLDHLDIKAYFTWIGTTDLPYTYFDLPTPQTDNHMIATYINQDGVKYFLDATSSVAEFGRPTYGIQGKEALIGFSKDSFEVYTVPVTSESINSEHERSELSLKGDTLKGESNIIFRGYLAEDIIYDISDQSEEELTEYVKFAFEKGSNKFIPADVNFTRFDDSNDSLKLDYNFTLANYASRIGSSIYINLNLTQQFKDFGTDEFYKTPLDLMYKNSMHKNYVFNIPQGYKVEFLPDNSNYKSDLMEYSISYELKENQIDYTFTFNMLTQFVKTDQLELWNEGIKHVSKALDNSIKLVKDE